jgi:hypothetical protein
MCVSGQVEIQAGIDKIHDLFRIEDPPGVMDQVLVGIEGFGGELHRVVLFDEGEDLGADGFRGG